MKELPILFTTEMVKATLAGTKTQDRRVIKPQPVKSGPYSENYALWEYIWLWDIESWGSRESPPKSFIERCPYGQPGDRLWVKETWQAYTPQGIPYSGLKPSERKDAELYNWAIVDKATSPELKHGVDPWIPSIFMPRWASRITLEITGVRVERVQEITDESIIAEGIAGQNLQDVYAVNGNFLGRRYEWVWSYRDKHWKQHPHFSEQDGFRELWDSINAKRPGCSWRDNPFVWVIEFKRLETESANDRHHHNHHCRPRLPVLHRPTVA